MSTDAPYRGTFTPNITEAAYLDQVTHHLQQLPTYLAGATAQGTVVALDIDGTIVNAGQQFSPRFRDVTKRLVAAGVQLCIATGRSVPATLPVVRGLGLESAWVVSTNGAVIGHFQLGAGYRMTQKHTFDAREIVAKLQAVFPEALFGVEDSPGGFRTNRAFPAGELTEIIAVAPLEELLAQPVTRAVLRVPGLGIAEFRRALQVVDFAGVEHAIGLNTWLDLNPPGISKGTGIAEVCRELGTDPAHTVALGDGENDVAMLRFAGYGVAVGTQDPEVLRAAKDHTFEVERDGSAAVLEALARYFGA